MVYNIIPLVIILLSLAIIIFIIVKKFPQLSAIDVTSIKETQELALKDRIMIDRLWRQFLSMIKRLTKFFIPFWLKSKKRFLSLYATLLSLEKKYQKVIIPSQFLKRQELKQLLISFQRETEESIKDGNYAEAEKKCLEILNLDPKNREAYHYLGEVYLSQKNYDHALETFQHILKIEPNDSEIYFHLGNVYKALGPTYYALAQAFFKQAVDLSPLNPKFLDQLIEISIITDNLESARINLEKLIQVNPENQKISEFEERIKNKELGPE